MNTSLLLANQATTALSALTSLPITWLGHGHLRIGSHTFSTSESVSTSPNTILLTPYLPPAKALALRQQGLHYLDAAGNAFVHTTGIYLLIEGQTPAPAFSTAPSPVGLRLLYYLLSEPHLLQAPYRLISERAGVALGSVSTFFAELRQQGLVGKAGNCRLLDTDALLTRWIRDYAEVLRPNLRSQRYRWATAPGIRWTQLPMVTGSYWSGEPAARLLLQEKRFSPTSFTLYSPCLPDWGLVPDPITGPVEILLSPFPLLKLPGTYGMVPPLLVYTDLLLSGRTLDQELAQQVRSRLVSL